MIRIPSAGFDGFRLEEHWQFLLTGTRTQLLQWLRWNDPNGDYAPEDIEDSSDSDLREMALAQLKDGA